MKLRPRGDLIINIIYLRGKLTWNTNRRRGFVIWVLTGDLVSALRVKVDLTSWQLGLQGLILLDKWHIAWIGFDWGENAHFENSSKVTRRFEASWEESERLVSLLLCVGVDWPACPKPLTPILILQLDFIFFVSIEGLQFRSCPIEYRCGR